MGEMRKRGMDFSGKTILVTGCAGFIGANVAKRLLEEAVDIKVVGIDSMNDYYDIGLKETRLEELRKNPAFVFLEGNIADRKLVDSVFREYMPCIVVNLAAQAGVRYSIANPDAYIESNLIGFYNILEACRHSGDRGTPGVEHLVYASSSSVYGNNRKTPYSTKDKTDAPVSLYAATKKCNELLAYSYARLYGIPSTGLRFFTVYGPAGRPDMAYFDFTKKLCAGEKIRIFNYGNCKRDFTYIDDIVTGVVSVMGKAPDADENGVRHKVYNIGNNQPESLLDFVEILQQELVGAGVLSSEYDFEGHRELVPMQPGDVETTWADIDDLARDFGFRPHTDLRDGLRRFAEWYKEFYDKE